MDVAPPPHLARPNPVEHARGRRSGTLRILELIGTLDASGAETVVLNLSNELSRKGHSVTVCSRIDGPLAPAFENVACHIVPKSGTFDVGYVSKLTQLVRAVDADLIHSHLFGNDVYGFLAARASGRPQVCTIHGMDSLRSWKRVYTYRAMAPLTARIVAVSETLRDNIVERCRLDPGRVTVVRNGIDLGAQPPDSESQSRLRHELALPDNCRVIGAIGNVKRVKAYEVLLEAFARLRVRHPDVVLVIAGATHEDPPYTREILNQIEALGLVASVKLLGSRRDVRALLLLMDLFVLPSHSEGTSLALLEAMAAGRAIVATAVGGTPCVVTHGGSALLVEAGYVEGLAIAMASVLDDRTLANRLADQALNTIRDRYGLAQMVQGYTKIFEEAVGDYRYRSHDR